MASPALTKLWKLAQIDAAIVEIRKRAGALDVGQAIAKEIERLEAELKEKGGAAHALSSELTDLELKQKGIDEKLKRIDKEMYGGKVVNPREVENLEKEIANLKRQREGHDARILELWELVPPAKKIADELEAKIAKHRETLAARQKAALAEKTKLEADFKDRAARRPEAAKAVEPALLARYEGVRQKHGGIGMVEILGRKCGGCGMLLPERTIQNAKEDKTVTCEACHRFLYYTEGLV